MVGRWYVAGTCCFPSHFPKGQPKVQVAGKSPLLVLSRLATATTAAAPAPTTECPVRASSSPIALFLLLLLLQPTSPRLASSHLCTPYLAYLVQLLSSYSTWLGCLSLSTSEQTIQPFYRRVRISGRGHEIVNSRIVYSPNRLSSLSCHLPRLHATSLILPCLATSSSRIALTACLTACLAAPSEYFKSD